jgi:hypothetical protein
MDESEVEEVFDACHALFRCGRSSRLLSLFVLFVMCTLRDTRPEPATGTFCDFDAEFSLFFPLLTVCYMFRFVECEIGGEKVMTMYNFPESLFTIMLSVC